MLVETPIGTWSNSFVTEEVVAEEDSLVRLVEERAAQGLLFASSALSLATFERVQTGPDCLVLLEPVPLDTGIDFESVLESVRERAMEGWRFRGGLQGRSQVQNYVLGYAVYPGVVVTPFSHLVLAKDKNAHRLQVELVELRESGSVISGEGHADGHASLNDETGCSRARLSILPPRCVCRHLPCVLYSQI